MKKENGVNTIDLSGEEMLDIIKDMECVLQMLEDKIGVKKKYVDGRKEEMLKIIKEGRFTIEEIASKMKIERKNVSSIKNGLLKMGYNIGKDSKNRLVLVLDEA